MGYINYHYRYLIFILLTITKQMKPHKLSDVMFVVITITLLVVLDVLALSYFIYCSVTIYHSILDIIFWAIVMFSTFGTFNLLGIMMIKDLTNNQ